MGWIPSWLVDAEAFSETENEGFDEIGYVAAANAAVVAVFFIYFTVKRWKEVDYFSPKRALKPPSLPPPQRGPFLWIWHLIRMPESEFLEYAGFDALLYIRFYVLCCKISAAVAPFCLLVILPINVTSNYYQSSDSINSFSRMSMSNIKPGSPRLWAPVVGTWLLTFITFYFLNGEFRTYCRLRHQYLKLGAAHMRTILVEDVPSSMRSNAKLKAYFDVLYNNSVLSVSCAQDLKDLAKLIAERESVVDKLESCLVAQARGPRRGLYNRLCCRALGSGDRDARQAALDTRVEQYAGELAALNTQIGGQQARKRRFLELKDKHVVMPLFTTKIVEQGGGAVVELDPPLPEDWTVSGKTGPVEMYAQRLSHRKEGDSLSEGNDAEEKGDIDEDWRQPTPPAGARPHHGGGLPDDDEEDVEPSVAPPRGGSGFMDRLASMAWTVHRGITESSALENHNPREAALLPANKPDSADGAPPSNKRQRESARPAPEVAAPLMATKAFVTFRTYTPATIAQQVHHGAAPGRFAAVDAPEPRDVYWENIYITKGTRAGRRVTVDIVLGFIFVFYVVPVTLLYLILSQAALESRYDWVANLCEESSLFSALVSSLQPMALLALMATVPPMIRVLGIAQGCKSESENQLLALSRYFAFQVINVFLVTTTAGSVFDCISEIVKDPKKTFTLLGESLPKMCGFFTEYILIKGLSGLWMELTGFARLIQHYILLCVAPQDTPRHRKHVLMGIRPYFDAGWFNYPKYYAQDLLVAVVTLTYACVNPFILVVAIPYFLCAYLTYKHQMLYVYEPIFETGGRFFPKVFRRVVFAVLIAQGTMIGILLLKEGYAQAGVVGAAIIATWVFKVRQRDVYEPASETLPLEIAATLDYQRKRDFPVGVDAYRAYLQPELLAQAVVEPELEDDEPRRSRRSGQQRQSQGQGQSEYYRPLGTSMRESSAMES